MAADTRPYKSKEQDGQGNELIIRDQQLVEQASQTTMASGEYFEIVDVDGRMAKIPKANMVDIVREALGTLLNGLSDQTTVTKVPSLNGNTLGASSVATLASVLGGQLTVKSSLLLVPANGNASISAVVGRVVIIRADSSYFNGAMLLITSADGYKLIDKAESQGGWDNFVELGWVGSSLIITNKVSYNLNLPYIVLG